MAKSKAIKREEKYLRNTGQEVLVEVANLMTKIARRREKKGKSLTMDEVANACIQVTVWSLLTAVPNTTAKKLAAMVSQNAGKVAASFIQQRAKLKKSRARKERIFNLVKDNNDKMTTKELVGAMMEKVGMTELGARTYVYNARKQLGLKAPPTKH